MTDALCKNCGAPQPSLDTMTTQALERCSVLTDAASNLFDAANKQRETVATDGDFKILLTANNLIRYAHNALVRELTSALKFARGEHCGICTLAKAPHSCHDCYAVALWGLESEELETRLAASRAKFAERGEATGSMAQVELCSETHGRGIGSMADVASALQRGLGVQVEPRRR